MVLTKEEQQAIVAGQVVIVQDTEEVIILDSSQDPTDFIDCSTYAVYNW